MSVGGKKELPQSTLMYIRDDKLHELSLDTSATDVHALLLELYSGGISLPTKKWLCDHGKSKDSADKTVETTCKVLSNYQIWIPLYDVYSDEIYLIHRDNVFRRVHYDHYRLPTQQLLDSLTSEHSKMERMRLFMSYYDQDTLSRTYEHVIYTYSPEVGKELIVCMRPSFTHCLRHIRPWYTRSEVINLALNMGIIKPDTTYYTIEKLRELCDKVRENDISASTLLAHRQLILDSDAIHVVQYYTFNGAFFMNQYLRNLEGSPNNPVLENCIMRMWNLINSAPELDKEYTLYRFVDTDYLRHLKEGDIFSDPGFMSATRDPFYKNEQYKFGFILMKIRIPPRRGSCLSLEPWSHFAKEQEMVLPPYAKLRLLKRDRNAPYFNIDALFTEQVTTRYEFELVGVSQPKIPAVTTEYTPPDIINLLGERSKGDQLSVADRVNQFHDKSLDKIGQFRAKIGKETFVIMTEWHNSTISYKEFYAHMNRRGFSMYGFLESNPERILFFIEVVTELHELHVNYYFKWSDDSHLFDTVSEDDFLLFLSKLSYVFAIQRVLIYGRYRFCHTLGGDCTAGSYRADIYNYLKTLTKRFASAEFIESQFSYVQLDNWHKTPVSLILKVSDRDQFYQQVQLGNILTVADLYIDTVERHCSQIGVLEAKIERIYTGVNSGYNPLSQVFWVLEPYKLLHGRKIIASVPDDDPEMTLLINPVTSVQAEPEGTRMNRYRL
jgi:hypothetical protein